MHRYSLDKFMGMAIAIGVTLLFLWSSYSAIFRHEVGYLYHPATDRLFRIHMALIPDSRKPWEPFIPFHSLYYGEPVYTENLGTLTDYLNVLEADRKLFTENVDAWKDKNFKDLDNSLLDFESGSKVMWNLKYFIRIDLNKEQMIPISLPILRNYLNDEPANLLAVDAVLSESTFNDSKHGLSILEGALLIKGRASHEISKLEQIGYE